MSQVPEEKKKNPLMSFITDWIVQPLDNINYAIFKIFETMGLKDAIQELNAKLVEIPVFYTLLTQMYKYEVINHEVIPREGPAIICGQHQSLLDPITTGLSVLKFTGRLPFHMAKSSLMEDPYFNMFSRINRAIFVRRGESDQLAIERCIKAVEEGHILIIYPEGTLGPGNGKLLDFKKGVAIIADRTKAPVIPVATYGIDQVYGKGAKFPKTKGIIKIKCGDPISHEQLFKKKDKTTGKPNYDKAVRLLQRKVKNLWSDLWGEFSKTEETE